MASFFSPAHPAHPGGIHNLGPGHRTALRQMILNVLATPLADNTLAQIADGLPTRQVSERDRRFYEPDINEHLQVSPHAREQVRAWRATFDPDLVPVDSTVVQAYQTSVFGTRPFRLRLIEITALVVHTVAAHWFRLTNQPPYKCPPPLQHLGPIQQEMKAAGDRTFDPIPTHLYHTHFVDHDQYPMGVADVVGYWAEYQIFGGVVLFDRGESELEMREVFFHPDAHFMVFQLSEAQIDQFVAFGLPHRPSETCPFPMKAERDALRMDANDTFDRHIFRNRYERRRPVVIPWITRPPRRRAEDYPQLLEYLAEINKPGSDHP
ncbi:uncharacterized protein BO80DRAFT_426421 [Aspergillus ibericus CBS 121593]|uniref:Uncharacterized protein n=1 Tax=Aspergillus ibericus CBS 121593 TaxID=1448316 RepID=A0A395GVA9_9EURO|nr:hypothetical protein BO80DRAFT_426421 [Aspergillus ibericus CBS 121593]RAK99426.1 hypothetical protein BO80DRAFT_426421 [Aspergillus ibericus CBS 121593]